MTTIIVNFNETDDDAKKIKEIIKDSSIISIKKESRLDKLDKILNNKSIQEQSDIKTAILIGKFDKSFVEAISILEKLAIFIYIPYQYIYDYQSLDSLFEFIVKFTRIKMQQSSMMNNLLKYIIETNKSIIRHENKLSIKFYAEGDCFLINNAFDKQTADSYFNYLLIRTDWKTMYHKGGEVPRLVSIQHKNYTFKSLDTKLDSKIIKNKSIQCKPIYRHPTDAQPKSEVWNESKNPITLKIKNHLSKLICYEFNHALVQYYRNAKDYISEHVDKTLDISPLSPIVNVSLGRTRKMKLRNKIKQNDGTRKIEHIELKHGSVFVLGQQSNKYWMHSIRADKRMRYLKRPDELLFDEQRISLTFRMIATYIDLQTKELFGQGVPKDDINKTDDVKEMIHAFSRENREIDYTWNDLYGKGFSSLGYIEI